MIHKCRKLKMKIAITVGAIEPFIKAFYSALGIDVLTLVAY